MDDTVAFSMNGDPRGQGRPRATVKRVGKKAVALIYKDTLSREYEGSVAKIAMVAMVGRRPLEGPLSVSLRFRMAVPKSYSKPVRARMLAGEEPYFGAYDVDNMQKSILDAMNKIVYDDDRQIVRLHGEKIASPNPGVDVRVIPLAPQSIPVVPTLAPAPENELPLIVSPRTGLVSLETEQAGL